MPEERDLGDYARRILRNADIVAERVVALVRMIAAGALLAILTLITYDVPFPDPLILSQIAAAQLTLSLFVVSGALAYAAIRMGRWSPALGYLTSTADVVLILINLAYGFGNSNLTGDIAFVFPSVWLLPIIFAASALRFRPWLQIYVSAIGLLGFAAVILWAGHVDPLERNAIAGRLTLLLGPPPNILRLGMMLAAATILVLAATRARRLMIRAVTESSHRRALTRFLPSEIADIFSDEAALRRSGRQPASVLFVDMRDSTALAEAMAPEDLSVFMSEFRSRILRVVRLHDGVIDKFIGDGALILFGVPTPQDDAAARALACAQALCKDLDEWNASRPERIGVGLGLHHGPVFFGVLGDPSRLEATVLGDTVNVAARLEKEAREHGAVMLIVSGETLDAAGVPRDDPRFRSLGRTHLRGREAAVDLYALADPQTAPREAAHAL